MPRLLAFCPRRCACFLCSSPRSRLCPLLLPFVGLHAHTHALPFSSLTLCLSLGLCPFRRMVTHIHLHNCSPSFVLCDIFSFPYMGPIPCAHPQCAQACAIPRPPSFFFFLFASCFSLITLVTMFTREVHFCVHAYNRIADSHTYS